MFLLWIGFGRKLSVNSCANVYVWHSCFDHNVRLASHHFSYLKSCRLISLMFECFDAISSRVPHVFFNFWPSRRFSDRDTRVGNFSVDIFPGEKPYNFSSGKVSSIGTWKSSKMFIYPSRWCTADSLFLFRNKIITMFTLLESHRNTK